MIRTDIQNWQPVKFNDQPKVEGQKEKIDGTNLEETLFATNGQFCVGDRPIISPPLSIEIDINEFFDTKDLDSLKLLFGLPDNAEVDMSKVAKRSDGKITDFYVDGKRYAVRYDESGKIEKTLVMEFDENGNVTDQKIKNYNAEGKLENTVDYEYTNNGNQISQTRTARSAEFGNVRKVMLQYFGFAVFGVPYDVKYDQEGRITDITYGSTTYSLRYDENGNVGKALEMKRDENGNVTNQQVKNYNADGSLKNTIDYEYTYNGDEVSQTRTARAAGYYGDAESIFPIYFGGVISGGEDVKHDSEGRVTDFYVGDRRYSVRYAENGDVEKTIVQTFHDNGNVKEQIIRTFAEPSGEERSNIKNDSYYYDENGNQISHDQTMTPTKEYFERLMMIN